MRRSYFYTVIILNVSVWETVIVDEKHFPTAPEARAYARQIAPEHKAVIYRVRNDVTT